MASDIIHMNLAACINIIPINSVYRWEGELCDDSEDLLLIKTTQEAVEKLTNAIVQIHPYALPEVIALPVLTGFSRYLTWVAGEVNLASENKEGKN